MNGQPAARPAPFPFTFQNQPTMKKIVSILLCLATTLAAPCLCRGQNAWQLEAEAMRAYQRGYTETQPAAQAEAFEEAAERFERAARAWRQAGGADKAQAMDSFAHLARQNAKNRRLIARNAAFEGVGNLAGPGYKPAAPSRPSAWPDAAPPPAHTRRPRFSVVACIGAYAPLGNLVETAQAFAEKFEGAVFSHPTTFEQLIERFGGKFIPGEPGGQLPNDREMKGEIQAMPGIGLNARFVPSLEISLAAHLFRGNWTGRFPAAVFPFEEPTSPRTEFAIIVASAKGILADLSLRYWLPGRGMRLYVEAGARGQLALDTRADMELAGLKLPYELDAPASRYSPFAGAGLRAPLGGRFFAEAAAAAALRPDGPGFRAGGALRVGWMF
jgi:hypothetical protein